MKKLNFPIEIVDLSVIEDNKKVTLKNKSILGFEMKYEAFYLGTICYKDEILHVVSETEKLNALSSFALTDEEFKKYTFIE